MTANAYRLIGRLTSRFSSSVQKAIAHIGPLVEERRAFMSNGTLTKEEMDVSKLAKDTCGLSHL